MPQSGPPRRSAANPPERSRLSHARRQGVPAAVLRAIEVEANIESGSRSTAVTRNATLSRGRPSPWRGRWGGGGQNPAGHDHSDGSAWWSTAAAQSTPARLRDDRCNSDGSRGGVDRDGEQVGHEAARGIDYPSEVSPSPRATASTVSRSSTIRNPPPPVRIPAPDRIHDMGIPMNRIPTVEVAGIACQEDARCRMHRMRN